MVEAAITLLMKQIESGVIEPEQVTVPGQLIVRHSARRPHSGVIEQEGVSLFQPQETR